MDIQHVYAGRNDRKGSKHDSKGEVKQKADNNNIAMEKLARVNRKFAQASIRVSSSVNTMSMRYAKEKGLTSNQEDKIGRCIPDVEVDVDGVKVVLKFYIKHQLSSDVILGMPWVTKTMCGFRWKDEKCYCTIRPGFDEAKFMILEHTTFDENVLNKDCVNVSYCQEADCGDAMEKLEICDCDIVHDECKVDYNGIEVADSKANGPKNGIRHYGSCNYKQCDEMEEKKNVRSSVPKMYIDNQILKLIAWNDKEK
ncbi:33598_t:CDS:2, partial [Gigaspora margarita]